MITNKNGDMYYGDKENEDGLIEVSGDRIAIVNRVVWKKSCCINIY